MGKRKRPRSATSAPKQPNAVWDSKDELALFGVLDFCIKHEHVFPFNEENAVKLMPSAGSLHHGYTWDQIKRKLRQVWDNYGREDSLQFEELYEKGSACVKFLEDEQSGIKLNVELLEKLLKPTSFRKRGLTIKEASATPSTAKGGQSHTPELNTGGGECVTSRAQRSQIRELAKQSKLEWESPEGSRCEDGIPMKRIRHTKKSSRKKLNRKEEQEPEELENGTVPFVEEQLAHEDKAIEARKNMEKYSNTSTVYMANGLGPHEHVPLLRLGSEVRRLQGDPVPSPTTLERIHRASLRKKEDRILELQETIDANKEREHRLRAQLESFRLVQERREEGGDSLELFVSNLNQEISDLKQAKDDCRKIGKFTKLAGRYNAAREEMKMETRIPQIRRLMRKILGGCDDDAALRFPGSDISAGLRLLLSFGFGLDVDAQAPVREEQFEFLVLGRPPYSIIETLIDAAVCTWVFESNFPSSDHETGNLSLFPKYRELIASQDGAIALRNLELASHYALINSSRFHKMIDQTAEELATSLSKTLSPFFPRISEESEDNSFETWGEEASVWEVRQQLLIAIFKDALKIKAESLLTPERYELVYYPPGTVFDPARMEVETIDGAPAEIPAGEAHRVEHCLHVAIEAITGDVVKDTDPVSKTTIQYKNFSRRDATQALEGMVPIVLAKAVVVLKN